MTPEQKQRVLAAARELQDAMNATGELLDVAVDAQREWGLGDRAPRFTHSVRVLMRVNPIEGGR